MSESIELVMTERERLADFIRAGVGRPYLTCIAGIRAATVARSILDSVVVHESCPPDHLYLIDRAELYRERPNIARLAVAVVDLGVV